MSCDVGECRRGPLKLGRLGTPYMHQLVWPTIPLNMLPVRWFLIQVKSMLETTGARLRAMVEAVSAAITPDSTSITCTQ